MVALDAEVREPEPGARKRPFFEVFVVIVAALALVVGLYAFGNALADDNDDGVAATGAAAPTAAAFSLKDSSSRTKRCASHRTIRPHWSCAVG